MKKSSWLWITFFLFILFIISLIFSAFMGLFISEDDGISDGNTAVISLTGMIMPDHGGMFGADVASADEIIRLIDKAEKNDQIKAIILEINSGGGAAVASEEIARAVKKANKTTVAWIRDSGASGAYWVASAADHIVANPMSITGSIGVLGSYLGFSGLLDKYNVTYERFVSGKYKDIGSPLKEITGFERQLIQDHLDEIHEYFLNSVKENRNLESVDDIKDGQFFSGFKAKELGLVDELGGSDEAVAWIENKLNMTVKLTRFKRKQSLLDVLGSISNKNSFYVGQGIGSALFDKQRMSNNFIVMT